MACTVLKREIPPLPGSKQTQSNPCCGFQNKVKTVPRAGLFSRRHVPCSDHWPEEEVSLFHCPASPVSKPCLAFPSSLALPAPAMQPQVEQESKLVTSKICHASHVERATEVFPIQREPLPPQPPHLFPTGSSRVSQCQGGFPAKATNNTFNSGFLQNFPAGNKSQQNTAFATRGLTG